MKLLVLLLGMSAFSFNSFAGGTCNLDVYDVGNDQTVSKVINYKAGSLSELQLKGTTIKISALNSKEGTVSFQTLDMKNPIIIYSADMTGMRINLANNSILTCNY